MIIDVEFILKAVAPDALAAPACAGGVAGLDHKIGNDPVEYDAGIVAVLCVSDEILDRLGCGVGEKEEPDIACRGLHHCDGIACFGCSCLFAHFISSFQPSGVYLSESAIKSTFAILVLGRESKISIFLGQENLARFFLQYDWIESIASP